MFPKRMILCLGNNIKVTAKLSKKSMSSPTGHPILKALDCKRSIFTRAREMFYFILEWLISWLYTWNYFQNIKFQLENQNSCKLYVYLPKLKDGSI